MSSIGGASSVRVNVLRPPTAAGWVGGRPAWWDGRLGFKNDLGPREHGARKALCDSSRERAQVRFPTPVKREADTVVRPNLSEVFSCACFLAANPAAGSDTAFVLITTTGGAR